jgi:hypothetical protein
VKRRPLSASAFVEDLSASGKYIYCSDSEQVFLGGWFWLFGFFVAAVLGFVCV